MADTVPPRRSPTDLMAQALGHRISDPALLDRARTHTSRLGAQATPADKRAGANERLEFLGDAILGAALADLLCTAHPEADEGTLSRMKSTLASRATLAKRFDELDLAPVCNVGDQMGKEWPGSVKANLMEALLCAVYLDGGWLAARNAVAQVMGPLLVATDSAAQDNRQRLQEWCLAHHQRLPEYTCERTGGSHHAPEFTAGVTIAGHSAQGQGGSRRRAEAAAALALLGILGEESKTGTPK